MPSLFAHRRMPASLVISLWQKHCGAGRRRFLTCAMSSKELTRWHTELANVPALHVLPVGLGGQHDVRVAAWRGDKILGVAVATVLEAQVEAHVPDPVGVLTKRFGAAVSNRNMTANLDALLTPHLLELMPAPQHRARNEHGCGTVIEACVAAVHATGSASAIAELARFLVAAAGVGGTDSAKGSGDSGETNPKGRLLEMGGKMISEYASGPPHAPIFSAVASIYGMSASASGVSKKHAEGDAAAALLAQIGVSTTAQLTQRLEFKSGATATRGVGVGQPLHWKAFELDDKDLAAKQREGENANGWFQRGADDVRRCMCAPHIFPAVVRSVGVWQTRVERCSATLICVQATGRAAPPRFFVTPEPSDSNTKARRAAAELAHAHIVNLVKESAEWCGV